jgi:hypothetical protein
MPSGVVAHAALALVRRVLSLGRHGGAAGGLRMVGAAAAAAAAPVSLKERIVAAAMPYYRFLWPPSRRTYAAYLIIIAAAYTGIYFSHMRQVRTAEAEAEDARRRSHVKTSLENLLRYEDFRAGLVGSADPEVQKKLKQLKVADAKKLYALLFDDVENAPITAIGVSADDAGYMRAVGLLQERTAAELETAIERTTRSRSAEMLLDTSSVTEQEDSTGQTYVPQEYRDGGKLKTAVAMAKKVNKSFGKDGIAKALLGKAKDVQAEIKAKNKAARSRIIALIIPHLPKWICGTLLLMWTETMWGVLRSYTLTLPQQLTQHMDDGTIGRAAFKIFNVFFAFFMNFPIDTFADCLVDDVEGEVRLKLRSAVMATVLSQDR